MTRRPFAASSLPVAILLVLGACAGKRDSRDVFVPRALVPVPGWEHVGSLRSAPPRDLSSKEARHLWTAAWDALESDELDGAFGRAEEILERHEALAPAHELAALVEIRSGRFARAEERLARAESLQAEGSQTPVSLGARFLLASASGREEEALEWLERIRARERAHALVVCCHEGLRLQLAERALISARALSEVDPEAALREYEKALRHAPESPGLRVEMAALYRETGDLPQAEREAREALALEPEDAEALGLYAEILREAGRAEEALVLYDRARRAAPFDLALKAAQEELEREVRRRSIPPQYRNLRESATLTRQELAAALFFELGDYLRSAPRRPVIATDILESWARDHIADVLALGIMSAERNHTFGPNRPVSVAELEATLRRAAQVLAPLCEGPASEAAARDVSFAPRVEKRRTSAELVSGRDAIDLLSRLARWVGTCAR